MLILFLSLIGYFVFSIGFEVTHWGIMLAGVGIILIAIIAVIKEVGLVYFGVLVLVAICIMVLAKKENQSV